MVVGVIVDVVDDIIVVDVTVVADIDAAIYVNC